MIAIVSISIRQLKFSGIRGGLRCFLSLYLTHTHSHTQTHTHASTQSHALSHTLSLTHTCTCTRIYIFCNILISFPVTEETFFKETIIVEMKIELYDFRISLFRFFTHFILSSKNWIWFKKLKINDETYLSDIVVIYKIQRHLNFHDFELMISQYSA